jgi:hypothetical protein
LHAAGELLVVGLGALGGRLVALGLTRLRKEDQRRRIGSLRGEREVQEDERIRVPPQADGERVGRDPERDDERLGDDVLRCAEEARGGLGAAAEGVFARTTGAFGRDASRRPSEMVASVIARLPAAA